MLNDLIKKLEAKDTSANKTTSQTYLKKDSVVVVKTEEDTYTEDWTDDGEHDDGEEGDKIYGGTINGITNSTSLEFQVSVTDNFGYNSIKPCDPVEFSLVPSTDPDLFINEFMASNDSAFADEFGEYDDWVELYNGEDVPVWLGDKFLFQSSR